MASPSEAEVQAQWKAAVELLHETFKFASVNAENWVSKEDTLVQLVESDFNEEILRSVAAARSRLQSTISPEMVRAVTLPHLKSYIKHVVGKAVPGGEKDIIDTLYQWFRDTAVTVKSRSFSFGSPSASGGNQGNVTVLRVTKDESNFDIESGHAEAKRADCTVDRNTGSELDNETFRLKGAPQAFDSLQLAGSGIFRDIRVLSCRTSMLRNPSFDNFAGTALSPTSIPDWTSSVAVSSTNFEFDGTNYYRAVQGVTPYALRIKNTANLSQKLSTGNIKLRADVPYYLHVVYNREIHTASGTLTIRLGAINEAVVLAAQTGWNIIRVPATTGQNNWYKNFDEQDLDISIEWSQTTGDLLIDDVILAPYSEFDGTWYAVVANNTTPLPAMKDDFFTWTDSIATDSILQQWLARGYGRYLPHAGSPSITDP